MALWFGLMIILMVYALCWSPNNDVEKKEERYQKFKSIKERQEELEEFERRYKIEKTRRKKNK